MQEDAIEDLNEITLYDIVQDHVSWGDDWLHKAVHKLFDFNVTQALS